MQMIVEQHFTRNGTRYELTLRDRNAGTPAWVEPLCEHGCWWTVGITIYHDDPERRTKLPNVEINNELGCAHQGDLHDQQTTIDLGGGRRWLPQTGRDVTVAAGAAETVAYGGGTLSIPAETIAEIAEKLRRGDETPALGEDEAELWAQIQDALQYAQAESMMAAYAEGLTHPTHSHYWREARNAASETRLRLVDHLRAVRKDETVINETIRQIADWAKAQPFYYHPHEAVHPDAQTIANLWVAAVRRLETTAETEKASELLGW